MTNYSPLFEPLKINDTLTLKNRLVMAPMTTVSGNPNGSFSDAEISYLEQRARSEIGMIITPACFCHISGKAFENQVGCHDDSMIPSLARCATAINRHGALSFLQIHLGGNAAQSKLSGRAPIAPSAVMNRRGTSELPNAMTEAEIWQIVESFARAAGRAKQAGFTGIELHGANTYLFQQFFSPYTNKRTDQWGGDLRCDRCNRHKQHDRLELCHRLENRARFAMEVIKAVRAEVGSSYPISYRISPEEPEPDGYSTHDSIQLLGLLIPLGIDIVHVSSWEYGVGLRNDHPSATHPTKMIRDSVAVPVIGVGGITTPDRAMRVLNDGVELVALGRALLLDAEWGSKVLRGEAETIRTRLATEQERETLEIPEPMREYTRRSIVVGAK